MDINDIVKAKIIKLKLETYKQQYYDLSLEMEIAEEVGNDRLLEQSKKQMVDIKKALKLLEKKVAEFEKKEEAD